MSRAGGRYHGTLKSLECARRKKARVLRLLEAEQEVRFAAAAIAMQAPKDCPCPDARAEARRLPHAATLAPCARRSCATPVLAKVAPPNAARRRR